MTDSPDQSPTTAAQRRVLAFLARFPTYHALVELDQIRLLERDDILVLPSLLERGWIDHNVRLGAYRINAAGKVIAKELSP